MGHYASDVGYEGPSYPSGYSRGSSVTYSCLQCGAQVGIFDTSVHDAWHEELEQSFKKIVDWAAGEFRKLVSALRGIR